MVVSGVILSQIKRRKKSVPGPAEVSTASIS